MNTIPTSSEAVLMRYFLYLCVFITLSTTIPANAQHAKKSVNTLIEQLDMVRKREAKSITKQLASFDNQETFIINKMIKRIKSVCSHFDPFPRTRNEFEKISKQHNIKDANKYAYVMIELLEKKPELMSRNSLMLNSRRLCDLYMAVEILGRIDADTSKFVPDVANLISKVSNDTYFEKEFRKDAIGALTKMQDRSRSSFRDQLNSSSKDNQNNLPTDQSPLSDIVRDVDSIKREVNSFRTKYDGYPGDLRNAEALGLGKNSNSNGKIDGNEYLQVFSQLQAARKSPNQGIHSRSSHDYTVMYRKSFDKQGNAIILGTKSNNGIHDKGAFTPKNSSIIKHTLEQWKIGTVYVDNGSNSSNCIQNGAYNMSSNEPSCILIVWME